VSPLKSISFLVVVALLVGCHREEPLGEARPVPKKTDEQGWPLYEQPADGFALAVPTTWIALQVNPQTFDRVLEQTIRNNPEMKAMEQTIRQQVAAGMKFLGSEKASGGTNVTVMKLTEPAAVPLGEAAASLEMQFKGLPGVQGPVTRQRVRLRPGEAERLAYVVAMSGPGGPKRLAMTTWVLVRGSDVYLLSTTTEANLAATNTATFERIAQSFRFLGG